MDVANLQDIEQIVRSPAVDQQRAGTFGSGTRGDARSWRFRNWPGRCRCSGRCGCRLLRSVAMRVQVIDAIRRAGIEHARELAEAAVTETGMGRIEDKVAKNISQARGTPGIKCCPQVLSGDRELALVENAA